MSLPAKVKDLFDSNRGSSTATHDDSGETMPGSFPTGDVPSATSEAHDTTKHHNKLHKANDPRGWTDEERAARGHQHTDSGVGLGHESIKHPHDSGAALGGGYYSSTGALPAGRDHHELSTAGRETGKAHSASTTADISGVGSHSAVQNRHNQQPLAGTTGSGFDSSAGLGRHEQPATSVGATGGAGSHPSELHGSQQQPSTGLGNTGSQTSPLQARHHQGLAGAAGAAGAGAGLSALHDRHQQSSTGATGTESYSSTTQDRYQPETGLAAAAVPGANTSGEHRTGPIDQSTSAPAHRTSHAGTAAAPLAFGLASSDAGPATREDTNHAGNSTTRENTHSTGTGTSNVGHGPADTPYWGDLPRGGGVYNGVTGHGSGEDTTHHSSVPHGTGVYNTVLGHGSPEDDLLHKGTGAHGAEHQTPEQRQFMLRPQGQQAVDDRVNQGGLQHTERTDATRGDGHHDGRHDAAKAAGVAGAAGLAGYGLSREHGHGHGHQDTARPGAGSDMTRETGSAVHGHHEPLAHRTKHAEETRTHEPTHSSSHGHHGGLLHRDHKDTPLAGETTHRTHGNAPASTQGPSVTTGVAGQNVPTTSSSATRSSDPTSSHLAGSEPTHHDRDNHHAAAGLGAAGAGAAAAYGLHHHREGHNAASGEQPAFDAQSHKVPSSREASATSQAVSSTSQMPRDSSWTPSHGSQDVSHSGHHSALGAGAGAAAGAAAASGLHGSQTGSSVTGSRDNTGLTGSQDTSATHGGQHNVLKTGPVTGARDTTTSHSTGPSTGAHDKSIDNVISNTPTDANLPTSHDSKDPSHGGMYKVLSSGTPSGVNPEFGHHSGSGARHADAGLSRHGDSGLTASERRHENDGHSKALGGAAAGAGLGAAALGAHSAHERSAQPPQVRDSEHLRDTQAENSFGSAAPGSSALGSGKLDSTPRESSTMGTSGLGSPAPGSSALGGRKVTHKCYKCGEENDISSYFKNN